jgi:hypothetical protein
LEVAKKLGEFTSMTELQDYLRARGSAGGKKRAAKLTKKRRSEIASKAAKARWEKAAKEKSKASDDEWHK